MNSTAIAAIILFVTFFGLIALRIPVTFSLVASTLVSGFYLHVPLVTIFQRMGQGVYSWLFLFSSWLVKLWEPDRLQISWLRWRTF